MTADAVLVTGALGLIGNAVRARLEESGVAVVAIDRQEGEVDGRPVIACDVTSVHRLHAVAHGRRLRGVVHCGAFSGPMVARDDPAAMVAVNVVGTANMLELARIHGVKRFVFCSSTSAYGSVDADGVVEETVLHPTTLYGASKAIGEHLVAAYMRQYGLDGVSLRLSWVYGPRRTTDCVIRTMIENALAGRPTRLGFGADFHRQFIHVDDAARALIRALDHPRLPQSVYTVTGRTRLTVAEIGQAVERVLPAADISVAAGPDPVDDPQSRFDTSAAERDFGFVPAISLEDGIAAYADWLRRRMPQREEANRGA